jgi:hypothetical protein
MRELLICMCGMFLLVSLGTPLYGADSGDAKSLFEQKCGTCHNSSRATTKSKTEEEWKTTVLRMKNVNGCRITDEEAKAIIDYLTKNHGKAKPS